MAGSHGNHHILKTSEVEDLKQRGQWENFLIAASCLAEILQSGGIFSVSIVEDDTFLTREVVII